MASASDYLKKRAQKKQKKYGKTKSVVRIAVYRRVSTIAQAEEGQSLDVQKTRINDYINFDKQFENKELQITDFVDEGKSAKDLKREDLQLLLGMVRENKIDFIIVTKLDRLTRRLKDLQDLVELFEKCSVSLLSIYEKLDTNTATGRFFISILGSLSQLEREQISERVKIVLESIVKKQPVGRPTPFGYFYIPKQSKDDTGKYLPYTKNFSDQYNIPPIKIQGIDEVIYPGDFVSLIYSWYRTFPIYSAIAKMLNDSEIPTPSQIQACLARHDKTQIMPYLTIETPKQWRYDTVAHILSNSFYTGERLWNRINNRIKREREPSEWIVVKNSHLGLISHQEFIEVQQLIET